MLTQKDYEEIFNQIRENAKVKSERDAAERDAEIRAQGFEPFKLDQKSQYDHPYTMDNSTATILYIMGMFVGAIFKGNWLIWIVLTIIYLRFINRHK